MNIKLNDKVLHLSFADEPLPRADFFCGQFTKRQVGTRPYKQIEKHTTILPFDDKEFDIVIATHLLQFVDNPKTIFDEIRRISRSALLKEYSEFAEILFGWPDHLNVLDIENEKLIIRRKNPDKYTKFGPFFHQLYQEDASFHEIVNKNDNIFKLTFDWYEADDEIIPSTTEIKTGTSKVSLFNDNIVEDENGILISNPKSNKIDNELMSIIKQSVATLRTSVVEYFDRDRVELAKVQQIYTIE